MLRYIAPQPMVHYDELRQAAGYAEPVNVQSSVEEMGFSHIANTSHDASYIGVVSG